MIDVCDGKESPREFLFHDSPFTPVSQSPNSPSPPPHPHAHTHTHTTRTGATLASPNIVLLSVLHPTCALNVPSLPRHQGWSGAAKKAAPLSSTTRSELCTRRTRTQTSVPSGDASAATLSKAKLAVATVEHVWEAQPVQGKPSPSATVGRIGNVTLRAVVHNASRASTSVVPQRQCGKTRTSWTPLPRIAPPATLASFAPGAQL